MLQHLKVMKNDSNSYYLEEQMVVNSTPVRLQAVYETEILCLLLWK